MTEPNQRLRDLWDERAASYDQRSDFLETRLLAPGRRWVCERAVGDVLDLCCGTGANFAWLSQASSITGVDQSSGMIDQTRARAGREHLTPELHVANAQELPFADGRFDTVVCTYALCSVPDPARALAEAHRVLRPGGRLLLADHVASSNPMARWGQRCLEHFTIPREGEHFTRRPLLLLPAAAFDVVETAQSRGRLVEQLHARRA